MATRPATQSTLSMLSATLLITAFVLLCPFSGHAMIIPVSKDGTAPFETINQALYIARDGDTILVGPGTYTERVNLVISVTIESTDGPEATVLDGENSHQLFLIEGQVRCRISGFTLTHGYARLGGAIHTTDMAWLEVEDCVFIDNNSWRFGGAIYGGGPFAVISVNNCEFHENSAALKGGALFADGYTWFDLVDCLFVDNSCPSAGGAMGSGYYGSIEANYCVFAGNSGGVAGAVRIDGAFSTIRNCTFHDNESLDGATVVFQRGTCTFDNNIVTAERVGAGLLPQANGVQRSGNIYFGNADGPISGGTPTDESLLVDPLYCDYDSGDFGLCPYSPALSENSAYGQIGAFDLGCDECFGPIETLTSTWGAVRRMYR